MKYFDLQLFAFTPGTDPGSYEANPVNVTTQNASGKDMSPTIKAFYNTYLLENAKEAMVFTQFAKKQPIHGGSVEWRKWNTFAKALTPLTEGVIPTGETFGMTKIVASTTQHGSYVTISDRLEMEAIDDVIVGATEEMGEAEGSTYDTLTRNILVTGTTKAFCPKIVNGVETAVSQRSDLDSTAVLTPKMVNRAATWLKKNKAPKIDGSYVAIIHPSVAYDLRQSAEWLDVHKYADVKPIFNGEIGELHGVRFVESTNAKIYKANSSAPATYVTLFFGKDAFAVVDPEGEGMEMIIKDRSQVGGPLNQFSTIGYKFNHAAKILYAERMLGVESGSFYSDVDEAN